MNMTPPAMVERPASIATAIRLMLIGAGFSVLALAYSVATAGDYKDRLREELLKRDGDVTQDKLDSAFAAGLGFAVVFGLFVAGLWVWMAWKNGAGRGWARQVASALGAVNVIGAVSTLGQKDIGALSVTSTVVSLAIAVSALFLLWRPESSKFYADSAAARAS